MIFSFLGVQEQWQDQVYGCWHCGTIGGKFVLKSDQDFPACGVCGNDTVVSFKAALDFIGIFDNKIPEDIKEMYEISKDLGITGDE